MSIKQYASLNENGFWHIMSYQQKLMIDRIKKEEITFEAFDTNRVDPTKIIVSDDGEALWVEGELPQALRESVYEYAREDIMQGESVSSDAWNDITTLASLVRDCYVCMELADELGE